MDDLYDPMSMAPSVLCRNRENPGYEVGHSADASYRVQQWSGGGAGQLSVSQLLSQGHCSDYCPYFVLVSPA